MDQVINTGDPATDRQIAEEIRNGMEAGGMKATISPAPGGGLLIRAQLPGAAAAVSPRPAAMPAPAAAVELGGAERTSLQAALVAGDPTPLLRWLSSVKGRAEWNDYLAMIDAVSPAGAEPVLEVACQRGSPEALLARAAFHLARAWDARGSGTADTITEEGGAGMGSRAERARQDLLSAIRADPASPAPYALLIEVSLLHDELGQADGKRAFEEALRRYPTCISAFRRMLLACSEKWGGSHDQQLRVARLAAGHAGVCPDLLCCLYLANLEIFHYKKHFQDDDDAAEAHRSDPATIQELNRAFEVWIRPGYSPGRFGVQHLHCAAAWYYLLEDRQRLKRVMQQIGLVQCRSPWHLIGEPSMAFGLALQMAL